MRDNIAAELMNLKKCTMDEMITHFNAVVSEMNIPRKDKMTLLGMITAIGYEAQNAADVVPVRHGRWFLDGDYEYINCSECLYPFYMGFDTSSDARQYLAREERWKYCPNCGARMDGDA